MPLLSGISIGNKTAANRIAINAMECCDADTNGNPTKRRSAATSGWRAGTRGSSSSKPSPSWTRTAAGCTS